MSKLMMLFITPFLSSLLMFLSPVQSNQTIKRLALLLSLLPLMLLFSFGMEQWIGESVHYGWFPQLSIQFELGVDSLSFLFLALTGLIIPISLLAVQREDLPYPHMFYGAVLLLQGLLIGFFTAQDMVFFIVCWEAMLFPLFFMITLWGKERGRSAALTFLTYMIAGSSLIVAAVLALYFGAAAEGKGTFNLEQLASIASQVPHARWICAIFLLAFSVKTPLFPFHGWLPDSYDQASTSGTILLSALLSKAGIYGFLRIGLGLFPDFLKEWSPLFLGLALTGVLYGGLAAWAQHDYKRLIAYSSFSHVNFIIVGIFAWNHTSHEGAIFQAINHGITIAGLFLVAGWLEKRLGSTLIEPFNGLVKCFPSLCWVTMIFVLSSIAVPGTNQFIGELLILYGLFQQHPGLTVLLGTSVILSVMYMLRWMQHTYFQHPRGIFPHKVADIGIKELLIALPLIGSIFWVGLYPNVLLKPVVQAIEERMPHLNQEERP
ncbi:MAG: NuoM family protein [Parachlamydiaceae bacterium]